jgi:hypothetical protein
LCDEADGQELSEALATWRVTEVARSLDTLAAPEGAADASALCNFFASIPDASEEHQAAVQQLQNGVQLTREQGRLAAIDSVWRRIRAAPGFPPEVVRAIDLELGDVDARRETTDRLVTELSAATHLKDNPWFKLLTELRQLPVFASQDPMQLLAGFVPLLRIGASFSPELLETLKAFVREGNILDRARQFLRQNGPQLLEATSGAEPSGEDSTEETFEPEGLALPVKPRDLLPEQWQTILARYPSKAAAARSLPTDPQTITKHLRRLNIEERWTGA